MQTENQKNNNTVFIVDDDPEVRGALKWLFDSIHLKSEIFATATDFLNTYHSNQEGCLVTDVRMPGISGLQLLEQLKTHKIYLPVILMTGYGDIDMAVQAMKLGAVDFITKPLNEQRLIDQVQNLFLANSEKDTSIRDDALLERFTSLTPREKTILSLMVAGKKNKMIAHELDVSISTVELNRARIMKKMQTKYFSKVVEYYLRLQKMGVFSS